MEPTTLSEQSKPKSAAVSTTVGMLEALDGNGQTTGTWRLTQPRCTIGSSHESLICVDDTSMAAVHTLIVFGKNHTLIRAMGGQVRVSGRSVREWLIDEPTAIQCGATRFVVYPPGYQPNTRNASHRVSAGSVADQASRLRSAATAQTMSLDETTPPGIESCPSVEPNSQVSPAESSSNAEPPQGPPAFVVAKLDPDVVKTALEPLHLALQAASDGILELTRRANESAAQIVDIPPINNNLNEMTHAIETLEDRVNSISSYCESLLSNVTESIEGRMSRFDELLLKLAERPDGTVTHDPRNPYLHADEGYDATALKAYQTPSETFPQEPSQEASHQEASYEETSYEETSYEEAVSEQKSYVQSSYDEPADEVAFNEPVESSFAPAEPSYFSEMTNLASSQYTEEESIDASQSYSYETQGDDATETHRNYASEPLETSFESEATSEISNFDFNDYPSQVTEAAAPAEEHNLELPTWFTEAEPEVETATSNESISPEVGSDSAWSTAQLNPIYAEDSNRWLEETQADSFRQEVEVEISPRDLDSLSPMISFEEPTSSEEASPEQTSYGSAFGGDYDDETTATTERHSEPEAVYEETDEVTSEGLEEGEESEESIEAYMARLLQRVKGGSESEAAPIKATSKSTKSRETMSAVSPTTEPLTQIQASVFSSEIRETRHEPTAPTEFTPRQAAPEKSVDLAALRNLANDTARQALHNSSRKKNELILIGKVAIALLGLCGGILLLVLNGFRANVAMIGMIASFVVFLLWGYEAVVQFKVLQASKAKEASDNQNSENRPVSSHSDGV